MVQPPAPSPKGVAVISSRQVMRYTPVPTAARADR